MGFGRNAMDVQRGPEHDASDIIGKSVNADPKAGLRHRVCEDLQAKRNSIDWATWLRDHPSPLAPPPTSPDNDRSCLEFVANSKARRTIHISDVVPPPDYFQCDPWAGKSLCMQPTGTLNSGVAAWANFVPTSSVTKDFTNWHVQQNDETDDVIIKALCAKVVCRGAQRAESRHARIIYDRMVSKAVIRSEERTMRLLIEALSQRFEIAMERSIQEIRYALVNNKQKPKNSLYTGTQYREPLMSEYP